MNNRLATLTPAAADLAGAERIDRTQAATVLASGALRTSPVGAVGIELEGHLHHEDPCAPLDFHELSALAAELTPLPGGGRLTLEPGGQLEVSSAVHPDVRACIDATRGDAATVRRRLAELGLTWTHLGSDPWREPRRINPSGRYSGMERWFDAQPDGGVSGRTMMAATAGLQVNLEAGPPDQWAARVWRACALGPLLTAISGSSSVLAGLPTGLWSARQQTWFAIDPRISAPLTHSQDPAKAWSDRVLAAPVVLLDSPDGLRAADRPRTFGEWLDDPGDWPVATMADLQRQLSVQFPPLRLRGFLELRCLDALPEPWWPALVSAVVTWMDDERAQPVVDQTLAAVADDWSAACAVGLADPALQRAACTLLEVAVDLTARPLTGGPAPELDAVSELLRLARSGTGPGASVLTGLVAVSPRRAGAA